MRWRGRRQSDNFEDRRDGGGGTFGRTGGFRIPTGMGGGGVRRAGGPSILTILIVMVVLWFLGINPMTVLDGGMGGSTGSNIGFEEARPPRSAGDEELVAFVRTVLAETEDTWTRRFADAGETYAEPRLIVFDGSVNTACGFASAASGPFYCPGDQQLYIDLSFYRELRERFEAPGDFAQAYVVAHEVGHHVQNLLGVLPEFNRLRREMSQEQANALSVRVELQADCYAGIWASDARGRDLLESGDLDEALNAATQIGDDAIQRRTQGYVVPESFNHGTSEQRMRWFRQGFDEGQVEACNTFEADPL